MSHSWRKTKWTRPGVEPPPPPPPPQPPQPPPPLARRNLSWACPALRVRLLRCSGLPPMDCRPHAAREQPRPATLSNAGGYRSPGSQYSKPPRQARVRAVTAAAPRSLETSVEPAVAPAAPPL
mgnify:CR=1 FL=1